jgi:hypothetical protein
MLFDIDRQVEVIPECYQIYHTADPLYFLSFCLPFFRREATRPLLFIKRIVARIVALQKGQWPSRDASCLTLRSYRRDLK